MSFTDLFESGEHRSNLGHFASLVYIAESHSGIVESELALLQRFARKLDITDQEYQEVLKDPKKYPINPPTSAIKRLERMLDLFKVILADHSIDAHEQVLIQRYAIGLGYSEADAKALIKRSIEIFTGGLDVEDYQYLLDKK